MPETQLGSMRLGSVDMLDEEQEGKTGVAPLIHIADGQSDEILGDIAPEYIIDDTHRQSLEDMLETFEFYTFGDKPFTQHLKDRNRIIIPDEDGTLREFIIYESEKYRDTEGYKMYVIGTASYLDLKKANVIRPGSFTGTASQHIGIALNDTEWRPGIVEVSGNRTIRRDDFTNPFDYLKTLAREFEGELRFRIEHNGNRITGRFVDLLERIGEWRGREIEFGKDLDGIRRIENTERIVTALIGLGPERDDGTRLEVFVEDTDALQRWGRPDPVTGELRHLIEVYEPESEREDMTEAELRQYTQTELNKRINAVVTYECSVVDLENVPGMESKQIRFGDTIKIKDTKFNPPLYIEARVFEQNRSIKSKAKKDIKLGDFVEYAEEDVRAIWRQLQEQIRKKISIADLRAYAEPKKIESDTPPPIREGENPIWVDTSGDIKVPHVVVGDEWVKMTPTTAEEVDAYTKQQTNEIAEDASRLKTGIIDVNQVPLRTSITGARIEWDGINGLVQYDADGNPVSWLDLDGNAHFENGYFSGTIEASEILGSEFIITTPEGFHPAKIDREGSFFENGITSASGDRVYTRIYNEHELPDIAYDFDETHGPRWRLSAIRETIDGAIAESREAIYKESGIQYNSFPVPQPFIFDMSKAKFTGSVEIDSFSNTLWTGALYPLSTHTIIPSKKITDCMTGWILRWQAYNQNDGSVVNSDFHYTHIPKIHVLNNMGSGVRMVMGRGGVGVISKYVYIYDDRIVGYDSNNTGDNHNLVLTGVFEY